MPGEVRYGSLPFQEQIDYFRSKNNVQTERWADMWKSAHDRGFTVAGVARDDLLADFRRAVDKVISEGKSMNWFKRQFNQLVKQYGWDHNGSAGWRAGVIYETNMRQSYTAGREQQIEAVRHLRPYGIYKHSGSEHPRLNHLSWNNMVLPLDDPWWKTHTPINGYGCKCKKLTASAATLKRLGLSVSASPAVEYYDWVDKVTGEAHRIPKGIDPGFDYTPKSGAAQTQSVREIADKKVPLAERLTPRVVDHAYSTVKGITAQSMSDVLSQLESDNGNVLKAFLDKHDTKTLILKSGELNGSKKAYVIADDVESYLQSGSRIPVANYYRRNINRTNGFTSGGWNHVVVKAKSTDSLKNVTATQISSSIRDILNQEHPVWSFSGATREMQTNAAGVLISWAHEVGHQIYFQAGRPEITPAMFMVAATHYSQTNADEWFAEHFVAWLFAPDTLKANQPKIYSFITETMGKTTS